MASIPKPPSRRTLIFSLCIADLRHEWLLSLCMVMAVASVLGPLLILFGLKFGTVETLRDRLIRDPRNCEIRPMSVRSYNREWFETLAARPDVAFVVPATRQLAASVDVYLPGRKEKAVSVDAIPTHDGDPLILENNNPVPSMEECLLTTAAAEAIEAKPGDTVTLVARRMKNGQFETGERVLRVAGILPIRAGATKAMFVRLPLLEAVESYKDGMGVPAFGWQGELPRAYPIFSAALILTPAPLGAELEFRVINNTGFTKLQNISSTEAATFIGFHPSEPISCSLLTTKGVPAGGVNLAAVHALLGGKQAALYPLVDSISLSLVPAASPGEPSTPLTVLPAASFAGIVPELPDVPSLRESLKGAPSSSDNWRQLLVAPSLVEAIGTQAMATLSAGEHTLSFPVTLVLTDRAGQGTALAPLRFIGVAGLLRTRPLLWDSTHGDFLLARQGYSGFRLYAADLESVASLKKYLEADGLTVHTEAERIDDVMRLDTYLSLIFWLIALGSLVGGTACLLSNIYAGIERKRRELAVLRLLGLAGHVFIRFPLYTSSLFAVAGFSMALLLFGVMATVINVLFSDHLQAGESLCRLAWWHPLAALGLTLLVALTAGGVAARRALSVDPADALRAD